ncbi:unnamed protein product [Durusdinium trenchii]|uniref:Cation/H+ exchanger domain-containing protein n=1 Tax=Durusdinium trenchii TaxID=1381693 RepID=A0ABP0KU02_9DINO
MVIRLHSNVINVAHASPLPETDVTLNATACYYPVQLGLAYLFLVGYLVRTVFVCAGLPPSVGVILVGFAFSYFFQSDLLSARDELQELSFFLVLLTAGLEIRLKDLRTYMFVMAFLPATFELVAIAVYACLLLDYSWMEGLVLGTILVAIGDGLVIPKMKEFGFLFKGHPLPRLMFTWAPLEASFALCLFGVLSGFAAPTSSGVQVATLVAGNVLRIAVTVLAGAVLGGSAGWLISRRRSLSINGKQVLTGAPVEAFLMIMSIALVAYALGAQGSDGSVLVPMNFISGAMFQPELMVIMTGVFFSAMASEAEVHQVERVMGGVWIFGQLILFSMIGSRTTLDIFPVFWRHVFPMLACGLIARFAGIFLAINGILIMDLPGHPFHNSMVLVDSTFCFLSVLPRATIQGALGQVPITGQFFSRLPNSSGCQNFIFLAARLYICTMSVVGMILLNTFGPRLIRETLDRPKWGEEAKEKAETDKFSKSEEASETLLQSLSEAYQIPESVLNDALQRAMQSAPQMAKAVSQPTLRPSAEGADTSTDLAFAQFDCLGDVLNSKDKELVWRGHQR